jgi:hypothetical protein
MRLRWLLALVGCAGLATGCDDPRSHTYAVTLLDAATIDCLGRPQDLLADPEQLEEAAKAQQKAWKERHLTSPPVPLARVLRVNELETRMQAWFDPAVGQGSLPPSSGDAGVSDGGGDSIAGDGDLELPYRYDDPAVVYEGDLQDGYIEGGYADRINTDQEDEAGGMDLCGLRTRAQGKLTITTEGGALGRIRWTHIIYVPSDYSACAGQVECVRDIGIEGLETD